MGRVIRHRRDYGAIIMCDERFQTAGARKQLSSWLRGLVQVYPNFGSVSGSLTKFFRVRRLRCLHSLSSLHHCQLHMVHAALSHNSLLQQLLQPARNIYPEHVACSLHLPSVHLTARAQCLHLLNAAGCITHHCTRSALQPDSTATLCNA